MFQKLEVFLVRMKMQTPFGHARATRDVAENVVVLANVDGTEGAGEGVPRDYVTGETPDGAFDAIVRGAEPLLESLDTSDPARVAHRLESARLPEALRQGKDFGQAAACAFELATLDAVFRRAGQPLRAVASLLGLKAAHFRPPIESARVSRVLDFNKTMEELNTSSRVFHHLKVKVGRTEEEDDARITEARRTVGPDVPISLDANMAWDLPTAQQRVERFRRHTIAWYEEPLAQRDWDSYRALRKTTGARVMMDESVCTAADLTRAIAEDACDLVNIRLSKCGGFIASCRMAEQAAANGVGFQLGAQVGQTGILWAAGRQFASTFRDLIAYEGAGARKLFADSLTEIVPSVDTTTFKQPPMPGSGLGTGVVRAVLTANSRRTAVWERGKGWAT